MFKRQSDSIFHPPCGSNVPGKVDANPFIETPPDKLRDLLQIKEDEGNEADAELIEKALRQWERQYQWPGYPYKKLADGLRMVAARMIKISEIVGPAQNIPYYQDAEVPEGAEGIIDSLRGLHDNYNMPRFDIPRQGERPERDIDTGVGDFSGPKDPIMHDVKPRGDGPDPDGLEVAFPPTGGDIDSWEQGI